MKKINFLFYLVLFFFVVNYVNAETLISDAGVEYDSKILDVLDNNAFVPIIIELNEFSDAEARNLLSIFDEDEIKNVAIRNLSQGIGIDLTEEAFFKLIQDERVSKIYYDTPLYLSSKDYITIDFVKKVSIILTIIIIALIVSFLTKKKKRK